MIDSHAHVQDKAFDADRSDVLERAKAAGVNGWIEVGTTVQESMQAVKLAQEYPSVYSTVGVHPHHIEEMTVEDWQTLEDLAGKPKVVAIGEVGFDFYRGESLEKQREVLMRFIALATKKSLPVVFHVRSGEALDAHQALIELLQTYSDDTRPKGVIHTYSGTLEQARAYIALGLHISFSGVLTFKNAGELVAVAKEAPANRLLIETDCPYLTPDPFRGQRNEPAYVKLVAQKLAELRAVPVEDIQQQTEENTKTLFQFDKIGA